MPDATARLRRIVRWLVIASFVVELLLSETWLRLARGQSVVDLLFGRPGWIESIAVGLLLGIALWPLSRWFFATVAREITYELFVPILGSLAYLDVLLLSLLPGVGEEVLFRGTLQPELGIVATSIAFGFMHSGFSRRLLPYGLWSALVGAALGALYLATGNLWGSVATHAFVNAAGVLWARRLAAQSPPPNS